MSRVICREGYVQRDMSRGISLFLLFLRGICWTLSSSSISFSFLSSFSYSFFSSIRRVMSRGGMSRGLSFGTPIFVSSTGYMVRDIWYGDSVLFVSSYSFFFFSILRVMSRGICLFLLFLLG